MKIPINLASQPFRRDRAMLAGSIAVSLLLAATLAGLISLALADRAQSADVRQAVNGLERQIRKVTADQAQLEDVLHQPENALVLERSIFINQLLLRKGISWTRIFADLEKVVPYNVKVLQINPLVTPDDHVALDMVVAAETQAPVIAFLRALGESRLFGPPEAPTFQAPNLADPLYKYRVTVTYAQTL